MPGKVFDCTVKVWSESLGCFIESTVSKGDAVAASIKRKQGKKFDAREYASSESKYRRGMGSDFYTTKEWRSLRHAFLSSSDGKCTLCGRSRKVHGCAMHVDHIKPRSKFPHLELDVNNLQLLCEDCNIGKSNK